VRGPRPPGPRDDADPSDDPRGIQPRRFLAPDLPEHGARAVPRRGHRPLIPDARAGPSLPGRELGAPGFRMEFETWEPFYEEIRKYFCFPREKDEAVAIELDKLLGGNRVPDSSLRKVIRGKEVTVAGNGPNVAQEIGGARGVLLTADEATSVALEKGLLPAILVTDLDGTVSDQVKANVEGAIAVIHGHGDNGPAVRQWAPRFSGATMATTQSRPFGGLRNFGGCTDGDRAVLLHDFLEGLHEAVERLLRLRLGRLDHERFFDEVREVHGWRMVAEIHETLRQVDCADATFRGELRGTRDELMFPEPAERHVED